MSGLLTQMQNKPSPIEQTSTQKIGKSPTPSCLHCPETETDEIVLLFLPYGEESHPLERVLGPGARSLSQESSSRPEVLPPLFNLSSMPHMESLLFRIHLSHSQPSPQRTSVHCGLTCRSPTESSLTSLIILYGPCPKPLHR